MSVLELTSSQRKQYMSSGSEGLLAEDEAPPVGRDMCAWCLGLNSNAGVWVGCDTDFTDMTCISMDYWEWCAIPMRIHNICRTAFFIVNTMLAGLLCAMQLARPLRVLVICHRSIATWNRNICSWTIIRPIYALNCKRLMVRRSLSTDFKVNFGQRC